MSPSGSVLFVCTIPPIRALSLSEFRLGLIELRCLCIRKTQTWKYRTFSGMRTNNFWLTVLKDRENWRL